MNVDDIFTRVKRSFGDESAVQVTEADVLRWINDSQREAVMQHEGLLQTLSYIGTNDSVGEYTLPTDLFTLSHVYYRQNVSSTESYFTLRFMSLTEMSEYIDGWDGDQYSTGVPQIYTRVNEEMITVFPRPDHDDVNGIKVIYSRYPVDVDSTASPLDLPVYYHAYIEAFCMMKAYEMDEDWESSDKKAAFIQSTLDFNNNRESWFGHESYPAVTVLPEDYM